jgi:hypothetical protein
MVGRLDKAQLLASGELVASPAAIWQDYNFGLPPALHFATGALFLGFVGVLSLAFASPGMAVPFGVFVAFIAAFFTVPTIFVHGAPHGSGKAQQWAEFLERGIAIEHGRCSGREASVLVLMLPVLIFGWAITIAAIAALV